LANKSGFKSLPAGKSQVSDCPDLLAREACGLRLNFSQPSLFGLVQFNIGMAGTSKSYKFDVVLMLFYVR
jgi:hypothetical protein